MTMTMKSSKETYSIVAESYSNQIASERDISRSTGIPKSTVHDYLKKYKQALPVEEVRNQGRPSKLDSRARACLVALLTSNQFLTSQELADQLEERIGLKVTPMTVRRHLHSLGYRNGLPRNVPALTDKAKEMRVRFATENTNTDWSKVFFSR